MSDMATVKLRFVTKDTDRHGNDRFYFRRPGQPKVRLPGEPGSNQFVVAYAAVLAGELPATPARPGRAPEGSFRDLTVKYVASPEFRGLDPATQKWRRRVLETIARDHGSKPVSMMEARHVRQLRDEKAATAPVAANTVVKGLRALFAWANERDLVRSNPAKEVKLIRVRSEGHHTWTPDEIDAFERTHPLGSTPRLALALLLYTACRREDVIRLGRQHVRDGRIRFTQAKNEHRNPVVVDVPLYSDLRAAIDAAPPNGGLTFLTTEHGKRFSDGWFGQQFSKWAAAAGLPAHCTPHGLRKANATILANLGASPHEIMSVTGHRTLAEVGRYTRAAAQAGLADAAIARLEGRPSRNGRGT